MSYLLLFIVSLLGGLLVFTKHSLKTITNPALAFSGAYLLGISFLHLLPELFHTSSDIHTIGTFLLIGFFLQLVLDYFSGGIEHGHAHINKSKIGKFPWLVLISLCIHALLEAFPIQKLADGGLSLGYLSGLLLHKIPISFILASLLFGYKLPKAQILGGIFVFACMGPIGIWLGAELDGDVFLMDKLLAIAIGIILHLSTTILLESNEEHTIQWKKLIPILLGFSLAFTAQLAH